MMKEQTACDMTTFDGNIRLCTRETTATAWAEKVFSTSPDTILHTIGMARRFCSTSPESPMFARRTSSVSVDSTTIYSDATYKS